MANKPEVLRQRWMADRSTDRKREKGEVCRKTGDGSQIRGRLGGQLKKGFSGTVSVRMDHRRRKARQAKRKRLGKNPVIRMGGGGNFRLKNVEGAAGGTKGSSGRSPVLRTIAENASGGG